MPAAADEHYDADGGGDTFDDAFVAGKAQPVERDRVVGVACAPGGGGGGDGGGRVPGCSACPPNKSAACAAAAAVDDDVDAVRPPPRKSVSASTE